MVVRRRATLRATCAVLLISVLSVASCIMTCGFHCQIINYRSRRDNVTIQSVACSLCTAPPRRMRSFEYRHADSPRFIKTTCIVSSASKRRTFATHYTFCPVGHKR